MDSPEKELITANSILSLVLYLLYPDGSCYIGHRLNYSIIILAYLKNNYH